MGLVAYWQFGGFRWFGFSRGLAVSVVFDGFGWWAEFPGDWLGWGLVVLCRLLVCLWVVAI